MLAPQSGRDLPEVGSSASTNSTQVDDTLAIAPGIDIKPKATAPSAHADSPRTSAERKLIIINIAGVTLPLIGLVVAMILTWGGAVNWYYVALLVGMSILTELGITVGYHRLFTHKSFKSPAAVRYFFAALGSMAGQGPVIRWCTEHRLHHQHSDDRLDPHSPHMGKNGSWGEGLWATMRGAFHSHVGWLFAEPSQGLAKYSRDLHEDKAVAAANRHFAFWLAMGIILPGVLAGLVTMSWMGFVLGMLWGGFVRMAVVHHITWSVNSVCHLWGWRPFESHDESRNNPIVGLLAMGEGWHNNHHAFPSSARHGLRWWELDPSWLLIKTMQLFGLAREIRVPDHQRMESKKRKRR
jgi:stearoyl-CoA desaturase (delta-9 desaturase)